MKLLTIRSGLQASAKISFHILLSIFLVCMFLPLGWSSEDTGETADDELLKNLALFSEILAYVQQYHLDTPDSKEIIEGAIKGMLRELDPYSQFIPDYLEFQTQNQGKYGGLGMVIGIREDMLTVITPFKGESSD